MVLGEDINVNRTRGSDRELEFDRSVALEEPAVVVIEGLGDPAAIGHNEPIGFRRIAEHDFSCLPGDGCAPAGQWSRRRGDDFRLSIIDDDRAPASRPWVLRGLFPNQFTAGRSPWRFEGWGPRLSWRGDQTYEEIYVAFWLMIEGADYENEATATKILYVAYGSTQRANHAYLALQGNGRSGAIQRSFPLTFFVSEMRADGTDPGGAARAHRQNVNNGPRFEVGNWHLVELWMRVNDEGAANGEMKWWLDGVLLGQHKGKRFRSRQHPRAFYGLQVTPVWGGSIGSRTREDYWRIDHFYISGK